MQKKHSSSHCDSKIHHGLKLVTRLLQTDSIELARTCPLSDTVIKVRSIARDQLDINGFDSTELKFAKFTVILDKIQRDFLIPSKTKEDLPFLKDSPPPSTRLSPTLFFMTLWNRTCYPVY